MPKHGKHKALRFAEVPCHRVVNADSSLGGFAHGSAAKKKLLQKEGVEVKKGRITGFEEKLF